MLEFQGLGSGNEVILFPPLRGAIAARSHQPMQHRQEHGPLDGELEMTIPP
jgi:hypothetical protein